LLKYRNESESAHTNRARELVESNTFHFFILGLTLIDVLLLVLQLMFHELHPEIEHYLFMVSIGILVVFMVEYVVKFVIFPLEYFYHFGHMLDIVCVMVTLVLELTLHGVGKEWAELGVVMRLWRVIRVVQTVAVEAEERHEEYTREMVVRIQELEKELEERNARIEQLSRQVTQLTKL
jgi:hypothetical protein